VRRETGARLLRLLAREAGGRIARLLRGMEALDGFLLGLSSVVSGVPTMTQASLSVWRRLLGGRAGCIDGEGGLSCSKSPMSSSCHEPGTGVWPPLWCDWVQLSERLCC
jgi:hypothetical protein